MTINNIKKLPRKWGNIKIEKKYIVGTYEFVMNAVCWQCFLTSFDFQAAALQNIHEDKEQENRCSSHYYDTNLLLTSVQMLLDSPGSLVLLDTYH